MTADIDTRRAAERLIEEFGEEAIARAEERIATLQRMRDKDGVATWRRIAAAIVELQDGLRADKDKQS